MADGHSFGKSPPCSRNPTFISIIRRKRCCCRRPVSPATSVNGFEWVPEKVLFGTDAYPYSDELGWEESAWIASKRGREALAIALTEMMRDGEISRDRAFVLARMVLRDNAQSLYGF